MSKCEDSFIITRNLEIILLYTMQIVYIFDWRTEMFEVVLLFFRLSFSAILLRLLYLYVLIIAREMFYLY